MPITGALDGPARPRPAGARQRAAGRKPGGASRFFVNDLNGPLYILDKKTKTFTTYLDFNGREGHPGCSAKLCLRDGWANGLVSLQFDPDYRRNGRFYTVHIEDPAVERPPTRQRAPARPQRARLHRHRRRSPRPANSARRRGDRVDRHEHGERDVRRHRAGAAATAPEHAHPSDWRSRLQPDRAAGRRRLARALHRRRRQRLRRIAHAIRTNPQRLDTLVGKDPADHSRSRRPRSVEHPQRERPLSHSERQSVRRHGRRAGRNLGATDSAIRIGCTGRSTRQSARTTACSPIRSASTPGKP